MLLILGNDFMIVINTKTLEMLNTKSAFSTLPRSRNFSTAIQLQILIRHAFNWPPVTKSCLQKCEVQWHCCILRKILCERLNKLYFRFLAGFCAPFS